MGARKRFSTAVESGADAGAMLEAAQAVVEGFVAEHGLDGRAAARLGVLIEEIAANALRHGGAARIAFTLEPALDGVGIDFEDDGVAFDPTLDRGFSGPDPETGGGVGLALLRAWGERMRWAREGGTNRLSLILRLDR